MEFVDYDFFAECFEFLIDAAKHFIQALCVEICREMVVHLPYVLVARIVVLFEELIVLKPVLLDSAMVTFIKVQLPFSFHVYRIFFRRSTFDLHIGALLGLLFSGGCLGERVNSSKWIFIGIFSRRSGRHDSKDHHSKSTLRKSSEELDDNQTAHTRHAKRQPSHSPGPPT